jgi:hypothetical protein
MWNVTLHFKFVYNSKTCNMTIQIVSLIVFSPYCNLQNPHLVYNLIKCTQWTLLNINVSIIYPLKKIEIICIIYNYS